MDHTERKCGCKGKRTCLLCEETADDKTSASRSDQQHEKTTPRVYSYCHHCNVAHMDEGWTSHPHSAADGEKCDFSGIFILENFVSESEEKQLCDIIYRTSFMKSQSGRRKQDYGPKVNFKKKKVKTGVFTGLPDFSQFLYERMKTVPHLEDFIPVELCNLEYVPERGSAIDPHFDDFWLWGERLVTLNLVSDTTLCFTRDDMLGVEVHVPLLQRSLTVVFGPARAEWKHAIHRHDIKQKRIAMTFRELSDEFRGQGKLVSTGQKLIDVALTFTGTAVGSAPA
ncbi:alpha-ketoglutarate-dependent dioxygenase alkB homolog 4-like [Haliotis rubra]|uniref:alpha-ketoglutarate-dependent dioxygenase alkB homolog 4-like n=1 Tax=Haliotis rubra TaxID=36100 RepID=UPI001EE5EA43|nr:alpha-ketoglutarate-dependent dioxygenase alkB homolog 4-like [Haliotis rubra]XP_046554092.1 alpha-ketoglutarate-dependent dioxygenase alkB homolog 4-like [Haliotis rubra]